MIWLRTFNDDSGPLFRSSQTTYRFVVRTEGGNYRLGPNFRAGEMATVKVILAPKELSYWDVD